MKSKKCRCPDCGELKDPDSDGWMMVRMPIIARWQLVCKECAEKARKSGALVVNY